MISNIYMFLTVAVFVLLIACINFMNLSTARANKRAKEVGVRKSLGSEKSQLISQFVVESIVLTCCAAAYPSHRGIPYEDTRSGVLVHVHPDSGYT